MMLDTSYLVVFVLVVSVALVALVVLVVLVDIFILGGNILLFR